MQNEIHLGFTGHRPNKLGGYDLTVRGYVELQDDLEAYIKKNLRVFEIVHCHSGLALGGDTVWSMAILQMKRKYPGRVLFHAEIPMMEQPSAWFKQSDIDFWHQQVKEADFKTVYGSLKDIPSKQRREMAAKYLDERNNGMVDKLDVLLGLYDSSKSGTGNAINYAKKINCLVHIVHPSVYF